MKRKKILAEITTDLQNIISTIVVKHIPTSILDAQTFKQ